jgi:hypothetical protein
MIRVRSSDFPNARRAAPRPLVLRAISPALRLAPVR